jgi:DNA-nicking Smr family endonuclease
MEQEWGEPQEYPIDGVLDLHMFRPAEAESVVAGYLEECRNRRIYTVRIIHGKGSGTLRSLVHAFLRKSPIVLEFSTAPDTSGWGATIAILKPE